VIPEKELRALRKRWEQWKRATAEKGCHRFVPVDPTDVVRMLDHIDELDNTIKEALKANANLMEEYQALVRNSAIERKEARSKAKSAYRKAIGNLIGVYQVEATIILSAATLCLQLATFALVIGLWWKTPHA